MEVCLIHGKRVYTEHASIPPDVAREGYIPTAAHDSSSDSSDSEDDRHRDSKSGDRKEKRRARREEKRSRRRERKEKKRDERNARKEPWKLTIVYRPSA